MVNLENPLNWRSIDGVDIRMEVVESEYPGFADFAESIRQMEGPEQEWMETVQGILELLKTPNGKEMTRRDADYPAKFKFVVATGIADNPSLSNDFKQQLIDILFPKEPIEPGGDSHTNPGVK